MSRMKKSKVGFVRKALEQEAAVAVEKPELVATDVIAELVKAADSPLTSIPSAVANVESEPTASSQQNIPPPATTSITSVEEEQTSGWNTRWGFQPETHPGITCKYCRQGGHKKISCVKKKHVDSRPPKDDSAPPSSSVRPKNNDDQPSSSDSAPVGKKANSKESNQNQQPRKILTSYEKFQRELDRLGLKVFKPFDLEPYQKELREVRNAPRVDDADTPFGFERNDPTKYEDVDAGPNIDLLKDLQRQRNDNRGRSGSSYVTNQAELDRRALENIKITPVNERNPKRCEHERNLRSATHFTDEDAARFSNYYQRRNAQSRQACGTRSDSNFDDRYIIRRHFQGDAYVVERDPQRRPDDFDL